MPIFAFAGRLIGANLFSRSYYLTASKGGNPGEMLGKYSRYPKEICRFSCIQRFEFSAHQLLITLNMFLDSHLEKRYLVCCYSLVSVKS